MKYNVLVTAIGSFSANETITSLKKDSNRVNRVYGLDIFPKEWHHISKYFDNVFKSPAVRDEVDYLNFLKTIISKNDINLIIPLTDVEVDFFNKYREIFEGILITIGDKKFIDIARDKEKLNNFLKQNSFPYIKTYSESNLANASLPLIGKPKNGRSSEGVMIISDLDDFNPNLNYSNYIFQDYIDGEICTIDILRNKNSGEIRLILRKELIRTKNGAGTTVELFHDDKLISLAQAICERMNAHGAFNMEFIRTKNKNYLIDLNPRFSAGIGFTALVGYDYVKNTISLYEDTELDPINSYKNIIAQKVMSEVINKHSK